MRYLLFSGGRTNSGFMPQFETRRPVLHTADQMFSLVADVEKYPEFLPLCDGLVVQSRKERDGKTLLVAAMTVGYKAIRETFTTQVLLKPDERVIEVKYIDGPFKYLNNIWTFSDTGEGASEVHFFIDYEFKSRILGALMGSMFDRAFRMFSEAFEKRADIIYKV
jgi:coenzyme Q-binding protein COQ10